VVASSDMVGVGSSPEGCPAPPPTPTSTPTTTPTPATAPTPELEPEPTPSKAKKGPQLDGHCSRMKAGEPWHSPFCAQTGQFLSRSGGPYLHTAAQCSCMKETQVSQSPPFLHASHCSREWIEVRLTSAVGPALIARVNCSLALVQCVCGVALQLGISCATGPEPPWQERWHSDRMYMGFRAHSPEAAQSWQLTCPSRPTSTGALLMMRVTTTAIEQIEITPRRMNQVCASASRSESQASWRGVAPRPLRRPSLNAPALRVSTILLAAESARGWLPS